MTGRRFLTVEQFADALQLSRQSVRRRIRQGRIKAANVGTARHHDYRIPASELDKLS